MRTCLGAYSNLALPALPDDNHFSASPGAGSSPMPVPITALPVSPDDVLTFNPSTDLGIPGASDIAQTSYVEQVAVGTIPQQTLLQKLFIPALIIAGAYFLLR